MADDATPKTSRTHLRGFASMDPERRRVIAALGGASTPPAKRSFSVNPELAAEAGSLGGRAKARRRAGA